MVQTNVKKLSEYGLQLREKTKLRYLYGMTERQFRNTLTSLVKIRCTR